MWAWVSNKCPAHECPGCSAKIAHRKRYCKGQFFWKGRDNKPSIWNFNEQILASDPILWPNNPVLNATSASISCGWGGRVPIQRPTICRMEDSLCLAGCYGWAWRLYGWSVSPDSLFHRDGELNGWDTRAVARIFFPVLLFPSCIGCFLSFSQKQTKDSLGVHITLWKEPYNFQVKKKNNTKTGLPQSRVTAEYRRAKRNGSLEGKV